VGFELESTAADKACVDKSFDALSAELKELKKQHGLICRKAQRKSSLDTQDLSSLEHNCRSQKQIEEQLNQLQGKRSCLDGEVQSLQQKLKRVQKDIGVSFSHVIFWYLV